MDISFIIVNYKSQRYLERCLLSLKKNLSGITYEVIVVNNDPEKLGELSALDNVSILNHCVNDGFAKACNSGAKVAKGKILFFLNPDTEILSQNFNHILEVFDSSLEIGIVAPQLLSPDGTVQPWSTGYNVTLWDIIKNNFGLIKSKRAWQSSEQINVDWVSGAGLAIRKSLFEEISGFDENFFMYFEDVDLCKKVIELDKKITFSPSVQILHFGGQSSASSSQQKNYYYASQDYYFKKHFGFFQLFILKNLRNVSILFKK